MNINYSQFYKGTSVIPNSGIGTNANDLLVKYEFNTKDKDGNTVMNKLTKKESFDMMKDIRSYYGDNVILEFSGDALALSLADLNIKKGAADAAITPAEKEAMKKRNEEFQKEIKPNNLTVYSDTSNLKSGLDKAIASVEMNSSMEGQGVKNVTRQNSAAVKSSFITIGKQQVNTPHEKNTAEYMEDGVNPEKSTSKLTNMGKADSGQKIDYMAERIKNMGNRGSFVNTTYMDNKKRTMGRALFFEQQKMNRNINGRQSSLKYITDWYTGELKKNPFFADYYK